MTTFDGRRYDNHNGGEFTLYRHTSLPYEVRAYYVKCLTRGRAYCNCGAAVKSGDDVITFKTCQAGNSGNGHGGGILAFLFHGHHGHHSRHRSPARMSVDLYKNGELTPGTKILRIGCGLKYQVILPTGTVVTIQSSGSQFINIWINPSSVDRSHTEGLCGSYDGNRNNDVYFPSNGRPDNNKNPQPFCMKWKAHKSIFYGVPREVFNYMNTFCSCINGKEVFCSHGHGIMTCTKSRYDITATILKQAKIPHISHRRRRDVTEDDIIVTTVTPTADAGLTNFTIDQALQRCKEMVESDKSVKTCWSTINMTDFNDRMDSCAYDLYDTGDEEWARGYITDVVEECLNTLAGQQTVENGTVKSTDQEPVNITDLCQQDCGDHGECDEGVCRCAPGFSGLICDVSAEDTRPTVATQSSGGDNCGCDRRITDDCNTIAIFGDNFVESSTLTCHYEFAVGMSLQKPSELRRQVSAEYVSINQVTCTLPEVKDGVFVAVSNNGQKYSTDWYLHTVYDSLCYDCVETGKTLPAVEYKKKENTCLINGICYGLNEKKSDDNCRVCDPSNNVNKWTMSADTSCKCSSETEFEKVGSGDKEDSDKTVTILAVVIGILSFITLVSLMYNCKMRSKRSPKEKGEYLVNEGKSDMAEIYNNQTYNDDVKT